MEAADSNRFAVPPSASLNDYNNSKDSDYSMMDVNWCLNCECAFEGTGPYCSRRCEPPRASTSSYPSTSTASSSYYTDEEDVIYHSIDDASSQSSWIGKGEAGIRAWAASIAPSSPRASSIASSPSSSRYSSRYSSPNSSRTRLPKLIKDNRKAAPAALGISTARPSLPSPSRPILAPLQTMRTSSGEIIGTYSTGNLSIASGATDSSLATPVSASPALPIPCKKSSMFAALTSHIRSLASSPSSVVPSSRPRTKLMETYPSRRHVDVVDVSSSDFDDAGELTWQYSGTTVVVDGPTSARKLSDMPAQPIPRGRNLSRA